MSNFFIDIIRNDDRRAIVQLDTLLYNEGISRDKYLDYTIGLYDREYNLIATGSCFKNTIRCLAVDSNYRGLGFMNKIISTLTEYQYIRGYTHLFLYTKPDKKDLFESLGFYEIANIPQKVLFMENKLNGFKSFLKKLENETTSSKLEYKSSGAVVINANPFTLGHRYLLENASSQCDLLHVFIVSEDSSLFPFYARKNLVKEETSYIKNIVYHITDNYMISNATFPSYFIQHYEEKTEIQANLDISVFIKIAEFLNIGCRFAGSEPFSAKTAIYNKVMANLLPQYGINFKEIKRFSVDGNEVSASYVRKLIFENRFDELKKLVPEKTYKYIVSSEMSEIRKL